MANYVIVGASLAGATAAITLREEGAHGTVTLIGAENEPPYERPPLSKSYLRGDVPFDKALVRPAAFYAEHGIETIFGARATRIDSHRRARGSTSSAVRRAPHRHRRAQPARRHSRRRS
jgi:3-phenylpropionate/trans-cinnamate dioxygenase ferredoxin reductase subunit